jgi:putative selenate reductase
LRQAGCEVHVFEQKEIPGGMVSAAIPEFRLTSSAIESDIQRILSSGIQLHDKYLIDQEKFKTIQKEFDAVFLAAGAQRSVKLQLDGIESAGVLDPLAFLYDVKSGTIHFSGKHVVIIGGGNTAMDAARTAYRLVGEHGSVTIVYRRTMKEMPADRGEIKAVVEEGVAIYEQTRPLRINMKNGHVSSLVCCKTVLSVKGKDGRPVPVDVPDSEFEILCDTVIPAIGQEIALDFLSMEDLKIVKGNYGTATPKLYVGGDALRGASTAINAIGDGRKAAIEILSRAILPSSSDGLKKPLRFCDIDDLMVRKSTREFGISPAEVAVEKRRNFNLVMSSLTAEEAQKEASRCLQCDLICNVCVSVCPNLANFSYKVDAVKYQMQKAVLMDDGAIGFKHAGVFAVEQSVQVLNIRDLCNECGNCTTFCPSAGRPFADKPGLCLTVKSLNAEGSGFFLSRLPDRMVLIYKEQNHVKTLSLLNDQYIYETDQVRAVIRKDDFSLIDVNFLTPCVREFHFTFAAEMSIILQGATQLL